jgi:hypothetical protein
MKQHTPLICRPAVVSSRSLPEVLSPLAQAKTYAEDAGKTPWDFAVEIESLRADGLSLSDLRWMVAKGYAEHAEEISGDGDVTRRFKPRQHLGFSARSCFVLTELGMRLVTTKPPCLAAFPEESSPPSGPTLSIVGRADDPRRTPSWDGHRRVLKLDGRVVKRFKQPSPSQEAVLSAFDEEGWPVAIDDPLAPLDEQCPKERLHDTIKRLNASQENQLLRFRGDGTGQRVSWALVDDDQETTVVDRRRLRLAG